MAPQPPGPTPKDYILPRYPDPPQVRLQEATRMASRMSSEVIASRLKEIEEEAFVYSILDHEILFGGLEIPPKRVRRASEPTTPTDEDWGQHETWRGANLKETWGATPSEYGIYTDAGTEGPALSEVQERLTENMQPYRDAHEQLMIHRSVFPFHDPFSGVPIKCYTKKLIEDLEKKMDDGKMTPEMKFIISALVDKLQPDFPVFPMAIEKAPMRLCVCSRFSSGSPNKAHEKPGLLDTLSIREAIAVVNNFDLLMECRPGKDRDNMVRVILGEGVDDNDNRVLTETKPARIHESTWIKFTTLYHTLLLSSSAFLEMQLHLIGQMKHPIPFPPRTSYRHSLEAHFTSIAWRLLVTIGCSPEALQCRECAEVRRVFKSTVAQTCWQLKAMDKIENDKREQCNIGRGHDKRPGIGPGAGNDYLPKAPKWNYKVMLLRNLPSWLTPNNDEKLKKTEKNPEGNKVLARFNLKWTKTEKLVPSMFNIEALNLRDWDRFFIVCAPHAKVNPGESKKHPPAPTGVAYHWMFIRGRVVVSESSRFPPVPSLSDRVTDLNLRLMRLQKRAWQFDEDVRKAREKTEKEQEIINIMEARTKKILERAEAAQRAAWKRDEPGMAAAQQPCIPMTPQQEGEYTLKKNQGGRGKGKYGQNKIGGHSYYNNRGKVKGEGGYQSPNQFQQHQHQQQYQGQYFPQNFPGQGQYYLQQGSRGRGRGQT